MEVNEGKKMKILCLHGFRTSGAFLKKQISKWDPSIFSNFDLDFPDGLYPAGGKSEIDGIFPGPYFEWFQFNKEFTEYWNLEECLSHLSEYITTKGPFDGFLGFSQGATLSGLLLGYQSQGKMFKEHPPFKFMISVSGSKFRDPLICDVAYKDTIKAKSVHFIGDKDWLKLPSEDLASCFEDPLIMRHPQGHTVPRLDEEATKKLLNWIQVLLVQAAAAKGDTQNGKAKVEHKESQTTDAKDDEKNGEAKAEHNEAEESPAKRTMEKPEVEQVQA